MCILVISPGIPLQGDESGEALFKRYCSRCHGDNEKRSGTVVFYSQKTLMTRYEKRSRQLFNKLKNIDKYSISNIMIKAVHEISDEKTLVKIVHYLTDPDLSRPDEAEKKLKGL